MDRSRDQLLPLAFGTWHTTVFMLVGVVAAHTTGILVGVLAQLSTEAGIGLFLLLWIATWWTTRRAFTKASVSANGGVLDSFSFLLAAMNAGGVTGFLFLLGVSLVAMVSSASAGGVFLALFSPVAYLVGAVIGAVLGFVDLGVLAAARALVRRPHDVLPTPE
jgi:hypothetical protein